MKNFRVVLAAAFLLSPTGAFAATSSAPFSGAVLSTCILGAGSAGLISPNADYTGMSSQNGGGAPSYVIALATGIGYEVTTVAPSAFTAAPAGAETNTTYSSSYALSGATTASEVDGAVPTELSVGSSTVTVNMAATKSSGIFPASPTYTAIVTVRCE